MIIKLFEDDLPGISLGSVMGTEDAGNGGLKHLPPRRLSLTQDMWCQASITFLHYLGLNAASCRRCSRPFFSRGLQVWSCLFSHLKKTRFANVKLNFVSCLPQDAVGLLPAGCSHQGESPPAAFYPSASTFGPPGWCSAGLSPAPAMWFPYDQLSQYLTNLSYLEGLDWVTVSDVDVALRSLKNLHLHLHLHQRAEGCCSEIEFAYIAKVFALSACNLIVYQGLQTSIGAKSIKDIKRCKFCKNGKSSNERR